MKGLVREINAFALVGVAATLVHVGSGMALTEGLHLRPLPANALAFSLALVVSYLGQTLVTFRVQAVRPRAMLRYAATACAVFAANQAIVAAVVYGLGWSYLAALIVVVGLVSPLSFIVTKRWSLA